MNSPKAKIVAVIDDDGGVRASLVNLLNAFGYDTQIFESAESFLATASRCKASCLLVDIHLGDISGIELVRQLAAEGFTYPIIFMTGVDDDCVRGQAEAAGCVAFLKKPFAAKLLVDALARATG